MADMESAVRVVTVADSSTTTHASTEICIRKRVFNRVASGEMKIKLTDAGLGDDPRETQEEHHAPDVEQTSHQHTLDPAEFYHAALRLLLPHVPVCSLCTKTQNAFFFKFTIQIFILKVYQICSFLSTMILNFSSYDLEKVIISITPKKIQEINVGSQKKVLRVEIFSQNAAFAICFYYQALDY
jgi:hypothetical protein